VFVSFISLIAYYRILKLLKNKKINNRISVKDSLLQLSKIYLTDVEERTIMAEIFDLKPELTLKRFRVGVAVIPKKVEMTVELFKDKIPID
jgi:hypothetical protein